MEVEDFLDAFEAFCYQEFAKAGRILMENGKLKDVAYTIGVIEYLCHPEHNHGKCPPVIHDHMGNLLDPEALIQKARGYRILLFADLIFGHGKPIWIFPQYRFLQEKAPQLYEQVHSSILQIACLAKLYLLMCDMDKPNEKGQKDLLLLKTSSFAFEYQNISKECDLEDEVQKLKEEKGLRYKKVREQNEKRLNLYRQLRPTMKNDTQVYKEILKSEGEAINKYSLQKMRTWKSRMKEKI